MATRDQGMVLGEQAEFRTGPRGAIQFIIPPDQTVTVDRLTTLKVLKAVQERGKPEEARTYKDSSGNTMDALFYWTKGEGMAFYGGSQRGAVKFPAQAQATKQ